MNRLFAQCRIRVEETGSPSRRVKRIVAVDGAGWLSSAWSSFAGLFDDGGTIGPGQWGIKSGMPEIIQGGTHGVSVAPVYTGGNDNRASAVHIHMGDIDARGSTMTPEQFRAIADHAATTAVGKAAPHLISASVQATKSSITCWRRS